MQNRNTYTTPEDFLTDESFQRWVRFQEDSEGWEEWTVENPQRAKLVEEARLWILAMHVPEENLSEADTKIALQHTWEKIQLLEKAGSPVRIWQSRWWQSAAAVLVVGIMLTWLYTRYGIHQSRPVTYAGHVEQSPVGLIEQTNNTDKPQLITLSDGSSVLLQPMSKLSYPKTFEVAERTVILSGEGFFEISKNPQRPFLVYANEIVTKVVGTSFRIKAYADQPNVEVVVHTGKVRVNASQKTGRLSEKDVLLLPNQAVRFARQDFSFEKIENATHDQQLAQETTGIEQINFEFTDVPVAQILTTLERAYLVEIDFPQQALKNCYLTTSLSDQPLSEKLNIICESLGNNTRYEMNGNHIIIVSTGCN